MLAQVLPSVIELVQQNQGLVRAVWGRIPAGLAFRIARLSREVDAIALREEDFRWYVEHVAAMEEHVRGASATRLVRLWHRALEQGPEFAAELLVRVGEEGDDLRQLSPFAGLLSDEERRLLLAAVTAAIT